MDISEEKKTYVINPIIDKALGFSGFILLIWIIFCFFSSFMFNIENRLKDQAQSSVVFKETCVSEKGKVRHEDTFFKLNIYCVKQDGNETFFYHEYKDDSLMVLFIDKTTFGLTNLKLFNQG